MYAEWELNGKKTPLWIRKKKWWEVNQHVLELWILGFLFFAISIFSLLVCSANFYLVFRFWADIGFHEHITFWLWWRAWVLYPGCQGLNLICYLLAVCPWESYVISLCLNILICKMGIIIVPSSKGFQWANMWKSFLKKWGIVNMCLLNKINKGW